MLPFKDAVTGLSFTVLAGVPVLIEQVFTDLVTGKLTLLVLHAFDVRIIHKLCVKPHCLKRTVRDPEQAAQLSYRVEDVVSDGFFRRRQPSFRPRGIVLWLFAFGKLFVAPLRSPVTEFPRPAVPACLIACLKVCNDLLRTVFNLLIKNNRTVLIADNCDAGMFCSRVNFDTVGTGRLFLPNVPVFDCQFS